MQSVASGLKAKDVYKQKKCLDKSGKDISLRGNKSFILRKL